MGFRKLNKINRQNTEIIQNNFQRYNTQNWDEQYRNIEIDYKPKLTDTIEFEEWARFLSFYRYYVDKFATDILGLKLYPFQCFLLRSMARKQNNMIIACRGLGKSYLIAIFMICMAILYPNIACGIASGVTKN